MRQVAVIEHNHAGSANRNLRGFPHLVRFAVSHVDGEGNPFPNGSINRVTGHSELLKAEWSDWDTGGIGGIPRGATLLEKVMSDKERMRSRGQRTEDRERKSELRAADEQKITKGTKV